MLVHQSGNLNTPNFFFNWQKTSDGFLLSVTTLCVSLILFKTHINFFDELICTKEIWRRKKSANKLFYLKFCVMFTFWDFYWKGHLGWWTNTILQTTSINQLIKKLRVTKTNKRKMNDLPVPIFLLAKHSSALFHGGQRVETKHGWTFSSPQNKTEMY